MPEQQQQIMNIYLNKKKSQIDAWTTTNPICLEIYTN